MGNHYDPRDDETDVERARREGYEEERRRQAMMPHANLRDQFAMAALTGNLARDRDYSYEDDEHARDAYAVADAMLAARDKK